MLENLIEELLEDEALTQGLSESDAQELLTWLISLLEEDETERGGHYVRVLGKQVAKLAKSHNLPVHELIELVELAWQDTAVSLETPSPLEA